MIIDTHIHLNDEQYRDILDEVIQDANDTGVNKMLVVGVDKKSSLEAISMANTYDGIFAAIGLHPSEVQKEKDLNLDWLKDLVSQPKVVAVGEIGLDYYWDKTYRDLQIAFFLKQIEIARTYKLPISVHSRDAAQDTLEILKEKPIPGVLHCFTYSVEMAREFVKRGYYLGIGGVVTFKNSRVLKEVVKEIDLRHLVSETDGPYLAPTPYRGKINRPAYLVKIIEAIAEIKKIDPERVKARLYQNAQDLFGI